VQHKSVSGAVAVASEDDNDTKKPEAETNSISVIPAILDTSAKRVESPQGGPKGKCSE